jgi:hypothetical protein
VTGAGGPTGDPPAPDPARARRNPDPLGRRAFFWVPATEEGTEGSRSGGGADPLGKRAFFSNAPADTDEAAVDGRHLVDRGPITVTCSGCGAVSRLGILDFLIYQRPVGYWLPRGQFDHRMTCPVCRRRVWAGVTVRRP